MARDTKDKILDAAEILFSQHGIAATSIRAIIAKANVNIAAIHYHFGCKDEVVKAVFFRRINPINEIRLQMLNELEASLNGENLSVEVLVSAFLTPAIEHFSKVKKLNIAKGLMARIHSEPDEVANIKFLFEDTFKRFFKLFSKALPHLSKEELMSRFTFMIGAMGIAFLDDNIAFKRTHKGTAISRENKRKYIIQFVTAGFEAPATV